MTSAFSPRQVEKEGEFEGFVLRNTRQFGRLAYLLTGDEHDAEDLLADVFLASWREWDTVRAATSPQAYVRKMLTNKAASWVRRRQIGRAKLVLFRAEARLSRSGPSGDAFDVRTALSRLPARRRACVVLRLAFDLSEAEVAETLDISVGTVKSQTSKGVAALRSILGPDFAGRGSDLTDRPSVTRPGRPERS